MARNAHSRLKISGTFIATTALHVGGTGASVETDLPLAVNGAGKNYAPATSLAGVFRAWCEAAFRSEIRPLRRLWGWQDTTRGRSDGQDQDKDESASFVFVENALLSETEVEIRDGVGIDRRWGTAADGAKFDRAILPAGTRIPLEMTVELPLLESDRNQMKAIVGHLLDALRQEKVRLGAAGTRGFGRIRLETLDICEQDLSTRNGMLKTLRGGGVKTTVEDLQAASPCLKPELPSRLKVTIHWTPELPTMTKSGMEGIEIDMLPLVSKRFCELRPMLTGGGIKGVLRSHAERIVRTLSGCNADDTFLKQVNVPLVACLFGSGGSLGQSDDDDLDKEPLVGRSALDVMDCFGTPIPERQWWELLSLTSKDENNHENPTAVSNHLGDRLHKADWAHAQHVAIDRWEGGASEGALFNALELRGEEWEPIVLELDFSRLPEAAQLPAVALLLLVLEDFADGEVPLGFAGNRGMGSVKVSQVAFALENGNALLRPLESLNSQDIAPSILPNLHPDLTNALHRAWTDWIETGLPLALEAKQ